MEDRVSPFSRSSLEALAEVLEAHGAFLAHDPESNAFRVKMLPDDRQKEPVQN
jgi:hypothetical protein